MKPVKLVEIFYNNKKLGRLTLTNEWLCAFEYDAQYIANGVSVSPLDLPLKNGVFIAKRSPFEGNFGVFDDCLPDGWGLLILDRYLQTKGINPASLTIPERLSLVGSSGRGAIEFRPDQSEWSVGEQTDYSYMAAEAQKILENKIYSGESIELLYKQGGSPGGARPKVFVKFEGKEWLVKFRAQNDPENIGQIEYHYSQLAKKCGIEMTETRLFDNKYFGTVRFDRCSNDKIHVVSAAGLLNADYRIPSIDYLQLFQLCQFITRKVQEQLKLFRIMVFNFLIGNKDDHTKNFAFILKENDWYLAPAYDLLPSIGIRGYHTTSINNSITPKIEDLLEVAKKSGLTYKKACLVYDEMNEIIKKEKY
jgi:serine/threonine-protein kinase HipA